MQHCYLWRAAFPLPPWYMGFLLQLRSGSPFLPTTTTQIPGDLLGAGCPHIHRGLMPSSIQHYWMVSSSSSVWSCGVSTSQTPRMSREGPPTSHLGGSSAYAAFWGSTVASLEVLNLLVWLFSDCSHLMLHGWGLLLLCNLSTYLVKAKGKLFPKTSRNEENTGREGRSGRNWNLLEAFLPRGLLNRPAKVLIMSAICLNNTSRARIQQVALSLVFAVLDMPRVVQTPASRIWLPAGVRTAAPGTKSKPWPCPWPGLERDLNLTTRIAL